MLPPLQTPHMPRLTKDDVFLLEVTEVADILGSIAAFLVCNAAALFADTGHSGSVTVRELSNVVYYRVDELKGKVIDGCHDASVEG